MMITLMNIKDNLILRYHYCIYKIINITKVLQLQSLVFLTSNKNFLNFSIKLSAYFFSSFTILINNIISYY